MEINGINENIEKLMELMEINGINAKLTEIMKN